MRRRIPLLLLFALTACEGSRTRTPANPSTNTDGGTVSNVDGGVVVTPTACASGADCAQGVCDRARGVCASCRTSDECDVNSRCEEGVCVISEPCGGDLDCTPAGRVCDTTKGRCVACNSAADCESGPCVGHACTGNPACTSSLECADLQMVCGEVSTPGWPDAYAGQGCVECVGVGDCADGEACLGGLCADVCAGRICGSVEGASCGSCPNGAFCSAEGRACLSVLPAQFDAEEALGAEGRVYVWRDGRDFGAATVWSVELAGSGDASLRFSSTDGSYLDGVAEAGGRVFAALTSGRIVSGDAQGILTTFAEVPGVGQSDSVWCQGLAGSAAYLVCDLVDYDSAVTSGLYRFAVDGQAPVLVDTIVQPSGFFVSGEDIVWSAFNDGQVGKSGLLSGQRSVLDNVQADLLGVQSGYAYYRTTNDQMRRVPVTGGSPETLFGGDRGWHLLGIGASTLYLLQTSSDTLELVAADLDGQNLRPVFSVFASELPINPQEILLAHEYGDRLYVVAKYGILAVDR